MIGHELVDVAVFVAFGLGVADENDHLCTHGSCVSFLAVSVFVDLVVGLHGAVLHLGYRVGRGGGVPDWWTWMELAVRAGRTGLDWSLGKWDAAIRTRGLPILPVLCISVFLSLLPVDFAIYAVRFRGRDVAGYM